MLQFRFPV